MRKNRSFARWLCLLLIVVAIAGVTMVSAMPRPGAWKEEPKPNPTGLVLEDMPIVVPANASEMEKNAAKELQHYLKEMTGDASAITTEGYGSRDAIYIGATEFAKANNVTLEAGAYTDNNGIGEGWVIKAVGESLVLTGGETRGPLYAVYHLLEDEFGVRWWNYWEELVPELDTAVLPYGFESSGEPEFMYRDIYIGSEGTYNLHLTRNRVNGFMSNAPKGYGGELYYCRPYHVHTFNRYFVPYYKEPVSASDARWLDAINPDKVDWYVEHPEWYGYSKVEGKHVSHSQMCLSNEEFIQTFIEKALIAVEMSYEDADKAGLNRPQYLDITPNDMPGGFCECPDCEAAIAVSGPSGLLLQFINKIAAAVGEVYPEIKLETLAYWQYYEAPLDDTTLADNAVIRLCHSDISVLHNLDHPINAESKRRLEDWAKILKPGQLWIWDYAINSGNTGSFPDWFRYQHDFQMLRDLGGVGAFIECEHATSEDFWDLKQWLIIKVMENPYQDNEALTMDFLNGYYGEAAADFLYSYLTLAWNTKEDYYVNVDFNVNIGEALWMSAEETLQCQKYFDEALAATEANENISDADRELYLKRIRMARHCIDKQTVDNYNRYVNEMAALNDPNKIFNLNKVEVGRRYVAAIQELAAMKLEQDYTEKQTVPKRNSFGSIDSRLYSYSYYLTEKDENTQLYQEYPEIPQQVLDDHPGIDRNHIYDFPGFLINSAASYMPGMYDLRGGTSYPNGTAVMFDLEELYEAYDASRAFNGYAVTESKPLQSTLGKKLYLNDPLVADGEWHLYRIKDVVTSYPTFKQFRFFEDTIYIDLASYPQFLNTPVDLYVSMKLEGDVTGQDPQHYGKIYVDRFIIVENCRVNYSQDIPATCESNAKQAGYCIVCGKQNEKELPYTKLPHTITSGYTYHADTNTYTADCATCGTAEFRFNGELPENVMADIVANGSSLDFVFELGAEDFRNTHPISVVQDPDSQVGKAALMDLAGKSSTALELCKITDTQAMSVAYNRLSNKLYAKDIILDGKYHAYKFPGEQVVTSSDGTLIFFSWELRGDFSKFPIMNQKVDFYFSMKVDGDLKYDDPANMPKYYIDRMIVVAACKEHKTDTYTNKGNGVYEGQCGNCGGVIRKAFADDLPQEVLDKVEELGTNVAHVHEYTQGQLFGSSYSNSVYIADDAAAAGGKALLYDTSKMTRTARENNFIFSASKPFKLTCYPSGHVLGQISADTLKANSGKGYQLYHWNNVLIPTNHIYTWGFDWSLQMRFGDIKEAIQNKNVDFYLSMKVENDPTYTGVLPTKTPKYYIDRAIVVDSCDNHLDTENVTITTPATCNSNAIGSGYCADCGHEISGIEVENSRLSHKFGAYELNEESGQYQSSCENCGTVRTKSDLPADLAAELAAAGIDEKHAHEYGPAGFKFKRVFTVVEDAASASGIAARARARDSSPDPGSYIIYAHESFAVSQSTGNKLTAMTYNMLTPMRGASYKLLKLEDLKLDANMEYLTLFDGDLMIPEMAELAGKTVDLYISMRVDGWINADASPDKYPIWYVERVIAVDNCDQYEIEHTEGGFPCMNNGAEAGKCPVCGKVVTGEGGSSKHSFTKYKRQKLNADMYVAECDYGCGTTDTIIRQPQSAEESLPKELPQNVRNHVVAAYSVADNEITVSREYARWDFELGRPVMVRSYDEATSTGQKNALDMTQALQIPINLWRGGANTEILGKITGGELKANADKGYQLYLLDDIIPIQYNEYRYLYMFNDWGAYIEQFDDDLRDYKDQVMDIYVYLKVEGDPTCQSGVNPTYYLDQVVVATSCTVDETWDIITEPTCSKAGFAIGTCSVCGLEGSEVNIPKIPHNVPNGYMYSAPTCEDNMVIRGHCTMCGWDYCNMEVEGSKLEHSFTNYKKLDDGSGKEEAWCDHGCGERHTRDVVNSTPDFGAGSILDKLPAFGGASDHGVSFSDIKSSDWYFGAVKNAMQNNLINGVSATEFRPDETLTTAQAIKLAAAYHERSESGEVTLTNGSGNWYSSYVDYAIDNGIVDGEYASMSAAEMNKPIDRSEFVAIFAAAMGDDLTGRNTVADNAIPDVDMDDENAEEIYAFYRAGILTGSDAAGTFNPHTPIKRSEVATILNRMFDETTRQMITLN